MSEHQTRQVDYGCANDGLLYEEAPDLGPLQEGAEAAELAEALSGLTASSGSPSSARDPRMRCGCGSPPAIRTPTISAVSTTMASHRAGYRAWPR